LAVLGLGVGALVALDAELLDERLLGPRKPMASSTSWHGTSCSVSGAPSDEAASVIPLPFDLDEPHRFDVPVIIADELLRVVQ